MVWVATSWELLGPAIALHSCITANEYEAILQEQVHSLLQMPLRYDIPVLQSDNLDIHIPDSDGTASVLFGKQKYTNIFVRHIRYDFIERSSCVAAYAWSENSQIS